MPKKENGEANTLAMLYRLDFSELLKLEIPNIETIVVVKKKSGDKLTLREALFAALQNKKSVYSMTQHSIAIRT